MNQFSWNIKVPILKNKIVIRQVTLVIGLPFILLMLFLFYGYFKNDEIGGLYGGLLILLLLVLTFILVMIMYAGGYDVSYVVDDDGVKMEQGASQAKRLKRMSSLGLVLGLLSKQYSVAGAALLGSAKTQMNTKWTSVKDYVFYDDDHSIYLKAGMDTNLIFCHVDNYQQIKAFVLNKASKKDD